MPPATSDNQQRGLRVIFRALSHRNFKLFFSGQIISLVGMEQCTASRSVIPAQAGIQVQAG